MPNCENYQGIGEMNFTVSEENMRKLDSVYVNLSAFHRALKVSNIIKPSLLNDVETSMESINTFLDEYRQWEKDNDGGLDRKLIEAEKKYGIKKTVWCIDELVDRFEDSIVEPPVYLPDYTGEYAMFFNGDLAAYTPLLKPNGKLITLGEFWQRIDACFHMEGFKYSNHIFIEGFHVDEKDKIINVDFGS